MSKTNEKETFGPFTLNTLCNTHIISKIPSEYSDFAEDVAKKCNPNETKICLTCQPLEDVDIVLDKERTDYIPELLGAGTFNDVYTLPIVGKNKNAVIRLFQPEKGYYRGISDDINQEIFGAFIQAYLSKSKDERGLGCPYINKVYDFGEYKSDNGNTNFRRIIKENVKPRRSPNETIDENGISTIQSGNIKKPYMILESLEMDLVDKIKDENDIPPTTILKYFQQILLGLKCMHENNLFHLDIKPANIMIDNDDNIKLVDFGMTAPITQDFPGGTSRYWSFTFTNKEYRKKNRMPIDDLWSVGLTILELLKIKFEEKIELTTKLREKGFIQFFLRGEIVTFSYVDQTKLTDLATETTNNVDSYGEEGIAMKKIMYALLNIFFVPTKGTFSTGLGRIRTTLTSRNDPFLTKGITEDTDLNKIKPRYESSNNHILTCEWLLDNFLGYPEGYIKDENIGGKRRKTRKRRYKKKSMKGKKKH